MYWIALKHFSRICDKKFRLTSWINLHAIYIDHEEIGMQITLYHIKKQFRNIRYSLTFLILFIVNQEFLIKYLKNQNRVT